MTVRLLYFTLCAFTFLFQINIYALESNVLEFKTEHDKGVWIKNYFKGKKIKISPPINATQEQNVFEHKFIQDFINQRNVQNIEPIAVGKSILDSEIAKYNTACPDRKPIDKYKVWGSLYDRGFGGEARAQISEAELEKMYEEDQEDKNEFIDTYRCRGNIKIYKLDVSQDDKKEQYILYCDDFTILSSGGKDDIDSNKNDTLRSQYLLFDPKKCMYPSDIFHSYQYNRNVIHGIMKYKNNYYFYQYHESKSSISKKYEGNIWIKSLLRNLKYRFFSADVIIGE